MSTEGQVETVSKLGSISYVVLTDPGRKRAENQDSHGVIESFACKVFMVADGMGGASGGAVASALAVEHVKLGIRGCDTLNAELIVSAIQKANQAISEKGSLDSTLSGMGTTLVGIAFSESATYIFNVGDSRLYRCRAYGFSACTEDHTLVQELLKSGAIAPEQARNHPVSHMLTRSLGPTTDLKVDCYELKDGPYCSEKFLLCSDGLYNLVTSDEIEAHLRECSNEEAAKQLIELANSRGGPDNITVMILELGEGFPKDTSEKPIVEEKPQFQQETDFVVIDQKNSEIDIEQIAAALENSASNNGQVNEQATIQPKKNGEFIIFSSKKLMFLIVFVAIFTGLLLVLLAPTQVPTNDQLASNSGSVDVDQPIQPSSQAAIEVKQKEPKDKKTQQKEIVLKTNANKTELDPKKVVIEGEATLLSRQNELKRKIDWLTEVLYFINSPSDKRNIIIQKLNDDKLKLSAELSALKQSEEQSKIYLSDLTSLLQATNTKDPVAFAAEISDKFPLIKEKYQEFEKVTTDYLKSVDDLKVEPNDKKMQNLDAKLNARNVALNALAPIITQQLKEAQDSTNKKLQDVATQKASLETLIQQNDANRLVLSEVASIENPKTLEDKKAILQKDQDEMKAELDLLS